MAPWKMYNTRVFVEHPNIPWKDWIKYLIVIDWHYTHIEDIIKSQPSKEFNDFVMEKTTAYLNGKVKATEASPAIMNVADDILAGRSPVIRAGDYITLQKEFKAASTRPRG